MQNEPDEQKKNTPAVERKLKKGQSRGRPPGAITWTFPKNTLEEAIRIPKAIEDQNAGNAMKADVLVKAVGFKQAMTGAFKTCCDPQTSMALLLDQVPLLLSLSRRSAETLLRRIPPPSGSRPSCKRSARLRSSRR